MTYIPGISQAATTQEQTTKTDEKSTLGQDEFLTLLVAQLQNQDPMNPTDATEFTAQLAQYSQLEQLFNLNESMDQLAEAQNNSERISALSLIGKEITVEGSEFTLGQDPVEIGYSVEGPVTDIDLRIQNQYGKTVATLTADDLSTGSHFITWNGLNQSGEQVAPGTYTIEAQYQGGEEGTTTTVSPLIRTEVTGVDLKGSEPLLVTVSGSYQVSAIHGAYDNSNSSSTEPGDGEESLEEESSTGNPTIKFSAATDGAGIIGDTVIDPAIQ